jgi:hypothetical protein
MAKTQPKWKDAPKFEIKNELGGVWRVVIERELDAEGVVVRVTNDGWEGYRFQTVRAKLRPVQPALGL